MRTIRAVMRQGVVALGASVPVAAALVPMLAPAQTLPLPTARYPDVIRHSLYVPTRDGTRLAVNIYQPANAHGAEQRRLPVIFAFTPYRARSRDASGKVVEVALGDRLVLRSLIAAGYVVAVADIRGKGASFGHRRGFQDRTEARDGYDLIDWLAHRPFSSGKVGMIGCSYLGGTTFQTAATAPPALKAAFIGATDLDKFAFVQRGGIPAQFNTRPDEPLSEDLASLPVDDDKDGALLRAAVAEHATNTPMAPLWYGMPYRDSVSSLTRTRFWQEVAVYRRLGAIRKSGMATWFWGNWQDEPTAQVILGAANTGGRFLAGPGGHCEVPPSYDFAGEIRRWFDHYLKGVANGAEHEPRATYWVDGLDGKGSWVRTGRLPGTTSHWHRWYLSDGHSGTARSTNDGVLAQSGGAAGADGFTVDYALPDPDYFAFWIGPMDAHGLSYTTAPLAHPLKLIGYPVAHLKVAADKPDADIFVYLDQIGTDGKDDVVAFGRLKLSERKLSPAPYRTLGLPWHSGRKADSAPLPPGTPAALAIDLTPISRVVPAGARLRLTITGADPRQRNLKAIMQVPPPHIKVLRGAASAAGIDLPVAD